MTVLQDKFDARVAEIHLYFSFLKTIVVDRADLVFGPHKTVVAVDPELEKILKATAILLLYNLVESSVRDALSAIYDSVATDALLYENLRNELRLIWIHNNVLPDSMRTPDHTVKRVVELVERVVADQIVDFDPKLLPIAGNLDAAKVRELASKYGFSHRTKPKTKGGSMLFTIKTERNNLAHGHKSFVECGRDFAFDNLVTMREQTVAYLRQIIENVQSYIDKKSYRK
jgi:hypothetical protein